MACARWWASISASVRMWCCGGPSCKALSDPASPARLVISDAQTGLKRAVREVLVGASWQRWRVHFRRKVLARVPKTAMAKVSATVRTMFERADRKPAQTQIAHVCEVLPERFPAVVKLLVTQRK